MKQIIIEDGKPKLIGVWTVGELHAIAQWLLNLPIAQAEPEKRDDTRTD